MDPFSAKPFRLYCNIPLKYYPNLKNLIPVALAILIQNDKIVVLGGLCFAIDSHYFQIVVEEKNGEYDVMIQDIAKEDCMKSGNMSIDTHTINNS